MSDESGASVPKEHRNLKEPWKPGQSGNPTGQGKKGSRNKFATEFVDALYADFLEHGTLTIQQAREKDPVGYVRICASLLPKEMKIERVDELTDAELDERIHQLAAVLSLEIRPAGDADQEAASEQPEQAGRVPTLQ